MSLRQRVQDWLRRTPIRHQLSFAAAAAVTVTALLSAAMMVLAEHQATRAAVLRDLQVQARMIAANSSAALVFEDREAATEILAALQASEDVTAARLLDARGRTLADYRAAEPAVVGEVVQIDEAVRYQGGDYGRLVIDVRLQRLHARLLLYSLAALGLVVLTVAVALLLFSRVVRLITHPVNELIALMQRIAQEGDYSRRSGMREGNEIGALASSFDAMLAEIQQRQQALSHELQERRRAQAELDRLARHDSLTRLGNRHALGERLEQVARETGCPRRQCALLLMDLDNFKVVNDSLGHQAGDELLVQIARRLLLALDGSLQVYRLGGDEFALVVEGEQLDGRCRELAGQLVRLSHRAYELEGHEVYATVSIGYALYPDHADQLPLLLRRADLALYAAKNGGRDTWRAFTPELQERAEQRLRLEADLRRAIEREEFFLVYEPQVRLDDGRLCGFEALLRWQHPQRGVVGPTEFIPLAEETGLIVPLGAWVLRRACHDGLRLQALAQGPEFRIAVNLAPRQLAEADFVAEVSRALAASGLPASQLELEVTESVMTERIELVAERMHAIAALGVSFALDDFGVGASSLSYLRRLPLRKLKIDRSFVSDLPARDGDGEIAAAIIAIGARLGLQVLAEGVETAEQRDWLREQDCALAQGWLYARPRRIEDVLATDLPVAALASAA